jgi:hypothetical protein
MSSRALQVLPRLARAASTSTGGATLERVLCTGRIRATEGNPQFHKIFFTPIKAQQQPILAKPPGSQVRDCDGELIFPTSTFSSVRQPIVWSAGRSTGFNPARHQRIVDAAPNGMISVAAMVNKQTRVVESFTYSNANFSAIQKASMA